MHKTYPNDRYNKWHYLKGCIHPYTHSVITQFSLQQLRIFSSWLSKWAPYMDSLAETSCKCHVGLRRKQHIKHINTHTEYNCTWICFIFSQFFSYKYHWKTVPKSRVFFCSSTYQDCQPNTDWPRWSAPTWSLMFICVQWCFFLGIDHLWAMWLSG